MRLLRFYSFLLCLVVTGVFVARAQDYVQLGRYTVPLPDNVLHPTRANALPDLGVSVGRQHNVLVQLTAIPSEGERAALAAKGLVLGDYLGNRAYWATLPEGINPVKTFRATTLRSVIPVAAEWKVDALLTTDPLPEWCKVDDRTLKIEVSYAHNVTDKMVEQTLQTLGGNKVRIAQGWRVASCELPRTALLALAAYPWVLNVASTPAPATLLNYTGASLSHANILSIPSSLGGRNLTGEGVRVGIWDGNVVYSPDFGNRVTRKEYQLWQGGELHGTHVAGTVLGSGMSDPQARGMAPKAIAWSWNFSSSSDEVQEWQEMEKCHRENGITLTQNSYGLPLGQMCMFYNQFSYNTLGRDVQMDQLVCKYPTLLPVYACGNDGQGCADSVLAHYGEKQYGTIPNRAKNSFFVGACDLIGRLGEFSSCGPLDDGRLAPHVVAKGVGVLSTNVFSGSSIKTGTSMACPTVSGNLALVTQRYKQLHADRTPRADLLRALAMNTATDAGVKGPDYKYGYGLLNSEKMVLAIERGFYRDGADLLLSQGETKTFTIPVPSGAKQARVMIAWNDTTAQKTYSWGDKALVNDLDLTVNGLLPWVCNPEKGEVSKEATRKEDHLNNQEQVTLSEQELSGKSQLDVTVTASTIPSGKQRFVLVWWFEEEGTMRFTSPLAGDQYAPGDIILAHVENYASRWKSDAIPSTIEISYDGGKTFGQGYTLPDSYSGYRFDIPRNAPATAEAMLRLTDNAGGVALSEKFIIAPVPESLFVDRGDGCDGTFMLSWKQPPIVPEKGYVFLVGDVDTETWTPVAHIDKNHERVDIADFVKPYLDRPKTLVALATQLEDNFKGKIGRRTPAIQLFSYAPLKLDITKLPHNETFQNWPLPYMAVKNGLHRKYSVNSYSESFVPQGSNLFQVDIDAFAQTPYDETKPAFDPKNKDYVFELRFCKIDMSAIPVGQDVVLRIRGAVIACDQNKPQTSAFRALWDEQPLKDARGLDIIYGKDTDVELVYVLKSDGGQHTLKLQHEGHDYNRYAADRLLITGIYFEKPYTKHDVGIAISKTPVDGAKLGLSTFTLTLVNGSLNEENNLKLNCFRNGKWVSSKKLPSLAPYDDRQMEYEVDLSTENPEGEDIDVVFTLDCEGDDYPQDNRAQEHVRNLGNIIPMPASYFLPREYDPQQLPQDPKLRYTIGKGKHIFTDNGGLHANYGKSQDATITFVPEDPSMKVRVTFRKFKTGRRLGILSIYTDLNVWDEEAGLPADQLDDDLTEQLAETPYVYVSGSQDGSLRIHFDSDNFEDTQEGWVAEVDLVPVTNPLTLVSAKAEYTSDADVSDVPVTIQIKNNTSRLSTSAGVRVEDAGRYALVQEIASIPAGLSDPTTLDKKIKDVAMRTARKVNVRLLGLDGDVSDNALPIWLLYDRYQFPQWKPATGDQEEHHVDFRKEHLTVYKADGKARTGFSQLEYDEEMYLRIWVDWNKNNKFEDDEIVADYTSDKIQPNYMVLYFDIDIAERAAGTYRLRAMYNSKEAEQVKNLLATDLDPETQVRDYVLDVVEGADPFAGDLVLTYIGTKDPSTGGTPRVSKDFSATEPLWLEVKNGSPKEFAGAFDVEISVDGKAAVTEEVEIPASEKLAAWSGTFKTKLKTTADLSQHGRHTIKMTIKEKQGGKTENNEQEIELFKIKTITPGQKLDPWCLRSHAFLSGRDKITDRVTVDRAAQHLWETLPSAADPNNLPGFTVEFWINPSRPHYGPILKGGGLEISTTYQSRAAAVRDNGIMVFLGSRAVAYTRNENADLIKPKKWTHVAVSIYDIKRAAAFGTGNCYVKIFINGEEVAVETDQNDTPSLNLGFTLLDGFDGMIDEFRIWNTLLTGERIKKYMYKHLEGAPQDDRANLIAEYSFDEGLGNAATEAGSPDYHMAYLESHDNRLALPDSVWVDPRKAMLGEILFQDQVRAEKVDNGKYKLTFLAVANLTQIKNVALEAAWNNAVLTYNGTPITDATRFDFSNNKEVKIKATVSIFGETYEQEVIFTGEKEKSAEAKITSASLAKTKNTTLLNDITAQIDGNNVILKLQATDGTLDVTQAKLDFAISTGAELYLLGQTDKLVSGATIDLSAPRLLIVKAENGRSQQKYTLRFEQAQTLTWTEPAGAYVFGSDPVALSLNSATESLNPIVGTSDNPSVATVLDKKIYIAGVGQATISLFQPAGKSYLKSNVLTKTISVTPKSISVKPTTTQLVYGAEFEFTYAFQGLLSSEHRGLLPNPLVHDDYQFKKADGTVIGEYDPVRKMLSFSEELLPGTYEIAPKTAAYTVGNYTITPEAATLTVSQGDSYPLSISVTGNGAPLAGAVVVIDGVRYLTHADGKLTIPVAKNTTVEYRVSKNGFIPVTGSVEMKEASEQLSVAMEASAITYTYNASEGGELFGQTTQVLAKGDTGSPILAQANFGYHFVKWDDDSTENPRADLFGETDKTFTASFERNTYKISYLVDGKGSIEGNTEQDILFEGNGTSVTAKPEEGYFFLLWSDGNTNPTRSEASVSEDNTLYAIFRTQAQLPYVNNFESGEFPEGWATTSRRRSPTGKALAWQLTNHPTWLQDKLDGYFFIIDADKDLKADFEAVLYSPRFELKEYDSVHNLLFTCTSYYRDFEPPTSAAKIQYECGDGWKDVEKGKLYAWNSNLNVQAIVKPADLKGKKYVQFRIVYEGTWSYWLLIDNVAIYYENKLPSVTIKYTSDPVHSAVFTKVEGGKVELLPTEDGFYVIKDCTYGQLPPRVSVQPASEYKFWKWEDGITTLTRPEQPATDSIITHTAYCKPSNQIHVAYRSTIPKATRFMMDGQEVTEQWLNPGEQTQPITVEVEPGYVFRYWLPDENRKPALEAAEETKDVVYTAVVVKEEYLLPANVKVTFVPEDAGYITLATAEGKPLNWRQDQLRTGDQVSGVTMSTLGYAVSSMTRNGMPVTLVRGVFAFTLGENEEWVINYEPMTSIRTKVIPSEGGTLSFRTEDGNKVSPEENPTQFITGRKLFLHVTTKPGWRVAKLVEEVNDNEELTLDEENEVPLVLKPAYSFVLTLENVNAVEEAIDLGISLRPNPVKDYLLVDGTYDGDQITIFSTTGQALLNTTALHGATKLDLRTFSEGLYLLRITRDGVVNTLRFVKH